MDVFSPEIPQILRLIIALGIVLALLGGFTLLLKKLGLAPETTLQTGDKKRLKIVESLPLDARRRLVILQCDTQEHLVILNANGETVIARDIHLVDNSEVLEKNG